jgi:hypothetical protein
MLCGQKGAAKPPMMSVSLIRQKNSPREQKCRRPNADRRRAAESSARMANLRRACARFLWRSCVLRRPQQRLLTRSLPSVGVGRVQPAKSQKMLMKSMVLPGRIELTTSPLPRGCSTTELRQRRAACKHATRVARSVAILAIRPQCRQAGRKSNGTAGPFAHQVLSRTKSNRAPSKKHKARQALSRITGAG